MIEEKYKIEKEKKQNKIHARNLLEEASEIVEPCTNCGFCKGVCPTFKVTREERFSPRGIAILLKEKLNDEIIFKNTLGNNQERICPANIKLNDAIIKARESLILRGHTKEKDEEMIKNLLKTGNEFGIEE